jgi:Xaa-Pro dipeptidase
LEHLGRILPVDTEQLLFAVQRTKTSDEIDKISEAVRIAETGVVAARKIWGVAVKELDIAAEADYAMRKAGSEGQWFATHVATGRRSVYPDAAPTRRLLKSGELGFIDLGPLYDHYAGDLTRSFVVGKHSRGQIELLALVKMALDNAVKMARVGIAAIDLYNSVGAIFCASGKRGYFPHHLGHGLGLFGSCPPVIDAGSQDILRSGDVFTLEPGLYVPGIGGCRMEDVFLMTDDGCKPISTLEHSWSIN